MNLSNFVTHLSSSNFIKGGGFSEYNGKLERKLKPPFIMLLNHRENILTMWQGDLLLRGHLQWIFIVLDPFMP